MSDVLDVFRLVRKAKKERLRKIPSSSEGPKAAAANEYLRYVRTSNQADVWDVADAVRDALADPESEMRARLREMLPALVVLPRPDDKSGERELFGAAFGSSSQVLNVETALDASLEREEARSESCGPAKMLSLAPLDMDEAPEATASSSSTSTTQTRSRTEQGSRFHEAT